MALTFHEGHPQHGTPALQLIRFTGANGPEIARFCGWQLYPHTWNDHCDELVLPLPTGETTCRTNDCLARLGTDPVMVLTPTQYRRVLPDAFPAPEQTG